MTIKDENGKQISLSQNDFLASGGEADIYVKNGTAYKIFQNKRSNDFIAKLKHLSTLNMKNIVRPQHILYDASGDFSGYSMSYLSGMDSMSKLFTKSFKSRNKLSNDNLLALIENMRKTTEFIHINNCLIVDGNENNYLFNKKDITMPYFIDVDSYQTEKYKATAYSPIITDPFVKNNIFNVESDWYAYAIITFQLLTNIHPFKGKHPSYTKKDVLKRMEDGISVFNKDVMVPSSVESFDVIPKGLLKWYEDLFSNKTRSVPPKDMMQIAPIKPKETSIKGSDKLTISETNYRNAKFILSNIRLSGNKIEYLDKVNNTEYVKRSIPVYPNCKLYGNVAVYSIFKANHFVVANDSEMVHVRLDGELDGYNIIDAVYKDDVLVVSCEKNKDYYICIFKQKTGFSREFERGYFKQIDAPTECNFTVLSSGVVILLDSDGDLVLTHKKKDQYKILKNVKLPSDGYLGTNNYKDMVLFEYNKKNYKVEMK